LPADLSKRFPARYHTARSSASSSSEGDRPRMSLSQARLIIPRSPSEYKACCRFARSHSEGLLLSSTPQRQLTDALKGSRRLEPKAFSETLMGGKMIPFLLDARRQWQSQADAPKVAPPTPVDQLKVETLLEGKIVRITNAGFLIDVHAAALGFLARRHVRLVPKTLLKKGSPLSNLKVINVNCAKQQFSLSVETIGQGSDEIQEVAYDAILRRIAAWAGVEVPKEMAEEAKRRTQQQRRFLKGKGSGKDNGKASGGKASSKGSQDGKGSGKGRGRGRGHQKPQRQWRPKLQTQGLGGETSPNRECNGRPIDTE